MKKAGRSFLVLWLCAALVLPGRTVFAQKIIPVVKTSNLSLRGVSAPKASLAVPLALPLPAIQSGAPIQPTAAQDLSQAAPDSPDQSLESAQTSAAEQFDGAAQELTKQERWKIDEIEEHLGPLVRKEEAPELHRTLSRHFDRLSAAQQRMHPVGDLPVNKFFLIDSPVDNAFVIARKKEENRPSNLVFVTTGLLKKMSNDGAALPVVLTRLAGVLSHELAHPLDNADSQGLGQKYFSGQAREIRADADGMAIAREAGYPVSAVHSGLKKLFDDFQKPSQALPSAISTHPHDELRLAAQRMLLTLDRRAKGEAAPQYPAPNDASFIQDLSKINKARDQWKFKEPASFDEAVDRYLAVPALKAAFRYKWIEENRLLLFIDDYLSRRGEQATPREISRLTEVMEASLAQYRTPMGESTMRKEFTENTASLEFLKYPPHEVWMTQIPAYRSKQYIDWVRSRFSGAQEWKDNKTVRDREAMLIHRLFRVCPPRVTFYELREPLTKKLLSLNWNDINRRHEYESLLYAQPLETKVRMAELMINTILPQISEAQRVQFFISETRAEESHIFPQFIGENKPLSGVLDRRMELMGNPNKRELQEVYRRLMAGLWENRGYFGVLDLAIEGSHADWEAIFSVLGIDRQVGYSQLRQAVKRFARSPAYAELIGVLHRERAQNRMLIDLYSIKTKKTSWMDDTLIPYLAGNFLKINDEERKIAGQTARKALHDRPGLFLRRYREVLKRKLLGTDSLSREEFLLKQKESVQEIVDYWSSPIALFDVNARLIAESRLNPAKKKALLKSLFLVKHPPAKGDSLFDPIWLYRNYTDDKDMEKTVARTLIETGTVSDTIGLFEAILAGGENGAPGDRIRLTSLFKAMSRFKAPLIADLRAHFGRASGDKKKFEILRRFTQGLLDPGQGSYWSYDRPLANTQGIRELKAEVVRLAQSLPLSPKQSRVLFEALAGSGPTRMTDGFFLKNLAARYRTQGRLGDGPLEELKSLLENEKIASSRLQLEFARKVLEPDLDALEKTAATKSNLRALIHRLGKLVPGASLKKDEYLEEIAWRLRVSGAELDSVIEEQKSHNWRRGNPLMVNLGSAAMAKIAALPTAKRILFIEYLLDPEKRPFPISLLADFERSLYDEFMAMDRDRPGNPLKAAKEAAHQLQMELEQGLMDATPLERIPLFELMIAAGRTPPLNEAGFVDQVSRQYLGYAPESKEENLLKAYLKIIPEHERSVSLAYLLAQVGEDKSSVKNLFQVFQTVGVKFGQMSSIWKIFGDAIAQETASLKDNAEPMTKAEILKELARSLSPPELAKIKGLKRIIGSASLKTVVLAELEGGKEAVIMVQRRYAQPQIDSNLRLAEAFIHELKQGGLLSREAGLFDSLLETVRSQLAAETQMSLEARRIQEAQSLYQPLEQSGWTFKVPGLVPGFEPRDNVLVIEKAPGVRFDRLPEKIKSAAGEVIVRSSLGLLFRQGWFDPDRHHGNQLIDPYNKTIYPIDFGQAMTLSQKPFWSSDDRLELARFLRALASSDAKALSRAGMALGQGGAAPASLKPLLDKALSEKDLAARVIAVVNAFAQAGAPIEGRFSFGAIKGLMTLYGEGYVKPERFEDILKDEIRALMIKKAIPVFLGQ